MKNPQRMRPMMEEYIQPDTSSSNKPQPKTTSHYEQNVFDKLIFRPCRVKNQTLIEVLSKGLFSRLQECLEQQ